MLIARPKSKQPIPKSAKCVFKGVLFSVYQWQQRQFDGSFHTYEKLKRTDTVSVFPVTDDNKIILTKQRQPGTKPFIGSVGGQIDPGETPFEAAKRELLEETGLRAQKYRLWFSVQPIEKIDWAIYCFIAKGISKIQKPHCDPGEAISLIYLTLTEFMKIITRPEFRDKEVTLKMLTSTFPLVL